MTRSEIVKTHLFQLSHEERQALAALKLLCKTEFHRRSFCKITLINNWQLSMWSCCRFIHFNRGKCYNLSQPKHWFAVRNSSTNLPLPTPCICRCSVHIKKIESNLFILNCHFPLKIIQHHVLRACLSCLKWCKRSSQSRDLKSIKMWCCMSKWQDVCFLYALQKYHHLILHPTWDAVISEEVIRTVY